MKTQPKACLLCGGIDDKGIAVTCINCGEATWQLLMPTFVPEPILEVVPTTPPARKKSRR